MPRKRNKPKIRVEIIVTIITTAGVIVSALIGILPQLGKNKEPVTMTPNAPTAIVSDTVPFTQTELVMPVTDTLQPRPTLTNTHTDASTATLTPKPNPTNTFTAISPSQNDRMIGSLVLSIDEGKAPLKVNFDARDSTYHFANGTTAVCRNEKFCSFTFLIRLGSQQVYGETNANGTLEYTFTKKGVYTVVVNVCRENVCDLETATVNIR